jgi:hypothetical protein
MRLEPQTERRDPVNLIRWILVAALLLGPLSPICTVAACDAHDAPCCTEVAGDSGSTVCVDACCTAQPGQVELSVIMTPPLEVDNPASAVPVVALPPPPERLFRPPITIAL